MTPPLPGSSNCSLWKAFLLYVLLVICTVLLLFTCYEIMKRHISLPRARRRLASENNPGEASSTRLRSTGLASSVVRSLPAVQFRKGIGEGDGHGNKDCAICLSKFHRGEWLRPLPNCDHLFHVCCIDTWFRSHSTCPLCRTNVLYDFNDSNSSALMLGPLEPLQREDARALGYHPEFRMWAMSGHLYETESDESFQGFVSPVGRPSNQQQTIQNLLKIAHNNNGESSSRDLRSNNEDHIYDQNPLA